MKFSYTFRNTQNAIPNRLLRIHPLHGHRKEDTTENDANCFGRASLNVCARVVVECELVNLSMIHNLIQARRSNVVARSADCCGDPR